MEVESAHKRGQSWRDSSWLVLVEFALVAIVYVARQHHFLKVSAVPYLFLLAWTSLRVRGVQWREIGFTRYGTWAKTLLLGIASGVSLELFDLFGKQPLLTRLMGKPPDLSGFPAVRGNLKYALLIIVFIWILAVAELGRWWRSVLQGYFHYHAVPGNLASLNRFRQEVSKRWLRALRRRGQNHPMTWARLKLILERWLPFPQPLHPYPTLRFDATYLR